MELFSNPIGKLCRFIRTFKHQQEQIQCQQEQIQRQQEQIQRQQEQIQQELNRNNRISRLQLLVSLAEGKNKILLINTPEHNNLGDHAIAMSSHLLLEKIYPNHFVIEISHDDWDAIYPFIIDSVLPKDIIFLMGGGHLGSIWIYEEELRRDVIQHFPNNTIISMPQSITFLDDEEGQEQLKLSQEVYRAHKNLTVMTRGKISYDRSKEYFPTNNHILAPDSVLFLEKEVESVLDDTQRQGLLFVMRTDKEKSCCNELIESIRKISDEIKVPYSFTDTVISEHKKHYNRHIELSKLFGTFKKSSLIVTDRLHGMIFSYLTKTPCIVFPSADHKIKECYEFLKECKWILFDATIESVKDFMIKYTQEKLLRKKSLGFTEQILNIYKTNRS